MTFSFPKTLQFTTAKRHRFLRGYRSSGGPSLGCRQACDRVLTVKIRVILALALAVAVATGTAGCNLIQPQATTTQYDASDGVGVNLGELDLNNMILLSDNGGESANLVVGAVNTSGSPITLNISYTSNGSLATVVTVIPSSERVIGYGGKDQPQIVLRDFDVAAGGTLTLTLQAGDGDTRVTIVPVLNTDLPEYRGLTPSPIPTVTLTPTPAETTAP
jgi:hypothetical protein